MIITNKKIFGARITEVHSTFEELGGCDCTTIYLTVDRGFTFVMPNPGEEWRTAEIPSTAERLPDQYESETYRFESGVEGRLGVLSKLFAWFLGEKDRPIAWTAGVSVPIKELKYFGAIPEPPATVDVIKRIKQRTIVGVYCPRKKFDCYDPDDSLLLFDDGSQAYCVTVAPHGLGATGLQYRTDVEGLPKASELVEFFDGPPEGGRG